MVKALSKKGGSVATFARSSHLLENEVAHREAGVDNRESGEVVQDQKVHSRVVLCIAFWDVLSSHLKTSLLLK